MSNSLCKDARLDISLDEEHGVEWITLTLTISYLDQGAEWQKQAVHKQEVGDNSTNRAYHRREAMVIGMRQLVNKAIEQQLISLSPGAWKISVGGKASSLSASDWGF
jgi:hypothetical protein